MDNKTLILILSCVAIVAVAVMFIVKSTQDNKLNLARWNTTTYDSKTMNSVGSTL